MVCLMPGAPGVCCFASRFAAPKFLCKPSQHFSFVTGVSLYRNPCGTSNCTYGGYGGYLFDFGDTLPQQLICNRTLKHLRSSLPGVVGSLGDSPGVAFEGPRLLWLQQRRRSHGVQLEQHKGKNDFPLVPFETYDAHRRQIRYVVELAVGCRRPLEFK